MIFLGILCSSAALPGCPPTVDDDDSSPSGDDDDATTPDDDDATTPDDDDDSTMPGDDDDDDDDDDATSPDDDDSTSSDDDDSTSSDDDDSAEPGGDPLQVCDSGPTDPYGLVSATLSSDLLTLVVSSSGGCEDHDWFACWDGSFMESSPVQANIAVYHDSYDDPCDAIVTATLEIDLNPMQDAWLAGYGPGPGEIVIHVDSETLTYSF
jgi:hypothetical protein